MARVICTGHWIYRIPFHCYPLQLWTEKNPLTFSTFRSIVPVIRILFEQLFVFRLRSSQKFNVTRPLFWTEIGQFYMPRDINNGCGFCMTITHRPQTTRASTKRREQKPLTVINVQDQNGTIRSSSSVNCGKLFLNQPLITWCHVYVCEYISVEHARSYAKSYVIYRYIIYNLLIWLNQRLELHCTFMLVTCRVKKWMNIDSCIAARWQRYDGHCTNTPASFIQISWILHREAVVSSARNHQAYA